MKTCTKCNIEKPKTEFGKDATKEDGFRSNCRLCRAGSYAVDREKLAAKQAEYRAANPEKQAAYRAASRERISANKAEYYLANPDKFAEHGRNRRARKISADGSHTASDVSALFNAQRGLCANCRTKLFKSGAKKYHVDHIMPLALGGSNWPANLQCLCSTCNLKKSAKDPFKWAAENGRLL